MRPLTILGSRPVAPVSAVSSSMVNSSSSGPCTTDGSSAEAMAAATPMPLSAPSVVFLEVTHSPSMTAGIGSLSKSKVKSLFFSATMSRWPCRMTIGAFSWPLDAGTATHTLPTESSRTSKPRPVAQLFTWARTRSSLPDGRGMAQRSAKCPQSDFGSRLAMAFDMLGSPGKAFRRRAVNRTARAATQPVTCAGGVPARGQRWAAPRGAPAGLNPRR